ncbi:MAG: hypothetical protein R3F59_05340 [Myxococcota bacterium]
MAARWVWVAAVAACGAPQDSPCDALQRCVLSVNPFLGEAYAAQYGEHGTCLLDGGEHGCAAACTAELRDFYLRSGSPACDPEPFTGEALLSEPEYAQWQFDHQCELYATCGYNVDCSDREPSEYVCWSGEFDPDMAEACMADPPGCRDNGADACNRVCRYD